MCYLIAKDTKKHGCFAIKTTHGNHLVQMKKELKAVVAQKGVQLVTITLKWTVNQTLKAMNIPESDVERVRH